MFTLFASLLLTLAGLALQEPPSPNPWITPPVSVGDTLVSGCVVWFLPADDGLPSIHANPSHQCAGVESVEVNTHGELLIRQHLKGQAHFLPILSVQLTEDESLVERGVIAGPSGGTGTTRVRFYSTLLDRKLDLQKSEDREVISCDTCNIWIGWTHVDGRPEALKMSSAALDHGVFIGVDRGSTPM